MAPIRPCTAEQLETVVVPCWVPDLPPEFEQNITFNLPIQIQLRRDPQSSRGPSEPLNDDPARKAAEQVEMVRQMSADAIRKAVFPKKERARGAPDEEAGSPKAKVARGSVEAAQSSSNSDVRSPWEVATAAVAASKEA